MSKNNAGAARAEAATGKKREQGKYNDNNLAGQLFSQGYEPIPIAPGQKYPTAKGWPTMQPPVNQWPANHGIGIRTGKLSAIDMDIYDAGMIQALLKTFNDWNILTRVGQPPKLLIPVVCHDVKSKMLSNQFRDQDGRLNRIEVLSYGQQFVAYGIHPDTGRPYMWDGDLTRHTPPTIPWGMITTLFSAFARLASAAGWEDITPRHDRTTIRNKANTKHRGDRPGDLYNRACSIDEVLTEYGWRHWRGPYWTRPGKKNGVSGTILDTGYFWCFTSSTVLEPDRAYDSFGLLTYFEFNGDFAAAGRAVLEVANVN